MQDTPWFRSWWLYLALAALTLVVLHTAYLAAESDAAVGKEFGAAYLVNLLATLRIAVPAFFIVVALVMAWPVKRGRRARSGDSAAALRDTSPADTGPRRTPPPARDVPASPSPPVRGIPAEQPPELHYGLLRRLEWRRFEMVCAAYLRALDYEVLQVGFGARHPVNLEVFIPGRAGLVSVVRCVARDRPADIDVVRRLLAAMRRRGVGEAMVFSVCGFTRRAARFAVRHRIAVVGGETLCERVRGLDAARRQSVIDTAVGGDYTTPTCPACGIKLVLRRKARRAPGRGEFWGCINFPRCRVAIPFR